MDARVIREGPAIADVYIDKVHSLFGGLAQATVSGYRPGGRRYASVTPKRRGA